jgi:predicted RNA-binding protein
MSDAWISQVAYMLDILERIPVWVTHDRFDLTGNNHDETFKNRPQLEGNPKNPNDFHSDHWHHRRISDTEKIADYMKSKGIDTTFWENIKLNKQNPWEKLEANDINKQMSSTRSNNGITSGLVNVSTT